MANQQLIQYIRQQLQQSRTIDNLKGALLSSGWTEADIAEAAREATKPEGGSTLSQVASTVGYGFRIVFRVVLIVLVVAGSIYAYQSPKVHEYVASFFAKATHTDGVSAKESYLNIRREEDAIKTYNDMDRFYANYSSKDQIAIIAENKKELGDLPDSFKQHIVDEFIVDNPLIGKITDIQESVEGDKSTLHILTADSSLSGQVTLVMEDGVWKLDEEAWSR